MTVHSGELGAAVPTGTPGLGEGGGDARRDTRREG